MTSCGLVFSLFLLVGVSSQQFPARRIRIVQGTPRPQPSVAPAPSPTKPIPARQPSAPNGPDAFIGLLGQCFSHTQSGYEYQLCPFKNFTQRELEAPNPWSKPFWGLLGVFDGMAMGDGEDGGRVFTGMRFEDGDTCGGTPRRATIDIACLTPPPLTGGGNACVLDTVSEPETCVYTSLLRCEAACTADLSVPAGFNPAKPHPSVEDSTEQGDDEATPSSSGGPSPAASPSLGAASASSPPQSSATASVSLTAAELARSAFTPRAQHTAAASPQAPTGFVPARETGAPVVPAALAVTQQAADEASIATDGIGTVQDLVADPAPRRADTASALAAAARPASMTPLQALVAMAQALAAAEPHSDLAEPAIKALQEWADAQKGGAGGL